MRTSAALRALFAATALTAAALAGQASAGQLLTNGGFESPDIGTGNYTYPGLSYGTIAPIGANQGGWTFAGSALVNGTGSNAWYGGAAPAGMVGAQFAALQATSSLSQAFTATAGALHLSWLDAGRPWGMGDQSYQVLLNGAAVSGAFGTASNDPFSLNTLNLTGLTAGASYNLAFQGLATTDDTAFIDEVQLSDVLPPPPPKAPSITVLGDDATLGANQFMIEDFDHPIAAGFSFAQDGGAYVRPGALGLDSGVSAPPPGDLTNYETVLTGGHAVLTSVKALQSISFYLGSPDTYNKVRFSGAGGFAWTLAGADILGGLVTANGDQGVGRRVSFDFGDFNVNKVEFSSAGNSFEFDSIAGQLRGGVPEPATWTMLILGFGAVGTLVRRRRTVSTFA
ncbi:PEPxxWA-CTERM sorting domain-containing protein [Phenylobacterium sp.]|uniref:PEPxxWA-CTERM sorting domain-containing protein n=1 Tax=Phenylobacterium sp. TaxID=1871053 RepID=UPI0025D9850D|nr:PEPxxWA-CTERM sorting domain-containing protein [Phenylobacterium sp.]